MHYTRHLLVLPLAALLLHAGQIADSAPSLEAASVKPNQSRTGGIGGRGICWGPGRVSRTNMPLGYLIAEVYGVKELQLIGRPGWFDTDRYDIEAKPAAAVTREQCMAMMQTLLRERFGLKLHRETRELPVFHLVVAKNGPKLTEMTMQRGVQIADTGAGRIESGGSPMRELALLLSYAADVDKMVVDRTGMEGFYEFKLTWAPQGRTAEGNIGVSVFTAVQEQLGLKLESAKGPVDVLVIDHIDRRPSEN